MRTHASMGGRQGCSVSAAHSDLEVIRKRLCQVRALNNVQYALNGWERDFLRSLNQRANGLDHYGREGGGLLLLSERQTTALDLLTSRHVDARDLERSIEAAKCIHR